MRTETIPVSDIELREGERISAVNLKNGSIVISIVERDTSLGNMTAGEQFLQTSRNVAAMQIDQSIWTDPDPRLRRILDR